MQNVTCYTGWKKVSEFFPTLTHVWCIIKLTQPAFSARFFKSQARGAFILLIVIHHTICFTIQWVTNIYII